ncbi:MAG: DUF4446 family protein [Eubacterium ramulus]
MEYLKLHIEDLTGISLDVITVGLAALVLILIIIMIVNGVKMRKLKKRYEAFMAGKECRIPGRHSGKTSESSRRSDCV